MRSYFEPKLAFLGILLACLLLSVLIFSKIQPYDSNLSALIGIWEGFHSVNPGLVEPNSIVFPSGGYDGQFFFLIAKSLYSGCLDGLIVDSFFFRLHRIGLPILVGLPSSLLGWDQYPAITLFLLWFFHFLSFLFLYDNLKSKLLSFFYLFNPFSWNANLLLVADGLFVSFLVLAFCLYQKRNWIGFLVFLTLAMFTRELGLMIAFSFFVVFVFQRKWVNSLSIALSMSTFVFFFVALPHLPLFEKTAPGTNPLHFLDMIDFPFFGFFYSFVDGAKFSLSAKGSIKLFLFLGFFILLCLSFRSIWELFPFVLRRNELQPKEIEFLMAIPILLTCFTIVIAEQGYWRSFDNLTRMFALCLPFIVWKVDQKREFFSLSFLFFSTILFFFLVFRILFITPSKSYFLSF